MSYNQKVLKLDLGRRILLTWLFVKDGDLRLWAAGGARFILKPVGIYFVIIPVPPSVV